MAIEQESPYDSVGASSHGEVRTVRRTKPTKKTKVGGGWVGGTIPDPDQKRGIFSALFNTPEIRARGLKGLAFGTLGIIALFWATSWGLTEASKYQKPKYDETNPADLNDNALLLFGMGKICEIDGRANIVGIRPLGSVLTNGFDNGINEEWDLKRVRSIDFFIDKLATVQGIDYLEQQLNVANLDACQRQVLTTGLTEHRARVEEQPIVINDYDDRATLFSSYMQHNIDAMEEYRQSVIDNPRPGQYTPDNITLAINNMRLLVGVYNDYANEKMGRQPTVVVPTPGTVSDATPVPTVEPPKVIDYAAEAAIRHAVTGEQDRLANRIRVLKDK